jgi:bifunctional DNA-binding transcriptional regulator/antitoxin component of YhaV-PrlF toxin-antitoxin module
VITIKGVCAPQPKTAAPKGAPAKPAASAKPAAADCKTVITKHEFELLLNSFPVAPQQIPQLKKNIENGLPRLIAMANQAEKKGLDKTPEFKEQLKIHRMQILAADLQQKIQQEAADVPEEKIAEYYKSNPEAYEQYSLERLFVPRTKQVEPEAKEEEKKKDEKLTEEQQKAKQDEEKSKREENEQEMAKLAESLRTRAAAGEDFATLQKEAYDAAGMKIQSPNVALPPTRRTGLPPSHGAVFDLKPGEVSQVINDAGGHYIYKVKSKDVLTLDKVQDEIHRTLQGQRQRDMMDEMNNSFKVETNEAYFGPSGPGQPGPPAMGGRMPPPPTPNPRVAPPATAPATQPQTPRPAQAPPATPQAQPQTPPPAQPPAQAPAPKPN